NAKRRPRRRRTGRRTTTVILAGAGRLGAMALGSPGGRAREPLRSAHAFGEGRRSVFAPPEPTVPIPRRSARDVLARRRRRNGAHRPARRSAARRRPRAHRRSGARVVAGTAPPAAPRAQRAPTGPH